MTTVTADSKAKSSFPEMADVVNQKKSDPARLKFIHPIRVVFCGPYSMEAEADVRVTRRPAAVLKHIVSVGCTEAVLVVTPRVEILWTSRDGEDAETLLKRATIRLVVNRKDILKNCPLDFMHDATGPLANPPTKFFYGADDAGRRLGLFLPNGSKVAIYIKGIAARVRASLDAGVYTTRV